MKRITDCDEETGIHAEASLVSLNKDTLTFKYSVPAEYTLGGQQVPANYYIFAVESYSEQDSWVRSTKEFSLQLPGFGANAKYPDVVLSEKLNMSTSIIVDLAGNPIDSGSSKTTLDQPAYMDNVAPTVGQVDIVRTHDANPVVAASPADGRARSELFTGIGDQLGFFVHFNEEMALLQQSDGSCLRPTNTSRDTASGELRYNLRQPFAGVQLELLAELNIGDSAETPLRAVAQYMTTIKDGSNGPLVSKVYFALDEPIGADLEPIMYGGEPQPIAINRILLTDKSIYALADTRGNLYDETTQLVNTEESIQVLPKQQLWLDNVPPTASTTVTWDDGESGYAPVDYSGGSEFEFYFPLTVTDQPGPGSDYASLTNGVQGYFVWQDNTPGNTEAFPFEYYVTGSHEQPTGAYKVGRTGQKLGFEQLDTGNFLHIRLSPDVEYNIGSSALVFHPTDNAGNEGNVSFPLVYQMDRMGPRINRVSYLNSYAGVDQGQISTTICLEDFNPILKVEYQWTDVAYWCC